MLCHTGGREGEGRVACGPAEEALHGAIVHGGGGGGGGHGTWPQGARCTDRAYWLPHVTVGRGGKPAQECLPAAACSQGAGHTPCTHSLCAPCTVPPTKQLTGTPFTCLPSAPLHMPHATPRGHSQQALPTSHPAAVHHPLTMLRPRAAPHATHCSCMPLPEAIRHPHVPCCAPRYTLGLFPTPRGSSLQALPVPQPLPALCPMAAYQGPCATPWGYCPSHVATASRHSLHRGHIPCYVYHTPQYSHALPPWCALRHTLGLLPTPRSRRVLPAP